jgi:hypothetical protein
MMSANKELDLEQITDLINKFVKFSIAKTPFLDIFEPGAITIRPTGNPTSHKFLEEMQASGEYLPESSELLSIDKIDVCEGPSVSSTCMAYAVFTHHAKFTFKGTPNDDLAVWTIVAKKSGTSGRSCMHSKARAASPTSPSLTLATCKTILLWTQQSRLL